MKNDYIPIYEYCRREDTNRQNVYRWIRENKFNPEDIFVEEIVVKRIRIKNGAKPKFLKNETTKVNTNN